MRSAIARAAGLHSERCLRAGARGRSYWPVSVLCRRRTEGDGVYLPHAQGGRRVMRRLSRLLGLDTLDRQYAYTDDPVLGHTSVQRAADRWVKTTCGYCSVGCGMEVGVRNGKAVAVRGWNEHPVSLGALCPKGLSEHHTLSAPGRALYPLRKRNGRFERVTWNYAVDEMVSRVSDI